MNEKKINLSSSNNVHNFTSKSLPPDAISLLNKRPNFIPSTTTTPSISAPCSLIHKRNHPTKLKSSKTSTSFHHFHPNHKQTHPLPRRLCSPYCLSLNNFYNLLKCVLLFILIYVTPTHTPHLTLQTQRTTMT